MAFGKYARQKKAKKRENVHDTNMVNLTAHKNLELASYGYSKDLESWNRENDYNSPKNQQARFKDAGLNPNLIYGQGSPGNASQLPSYQAPTADYTRVSPSTLSSGEIRQNTQDAIKNSMALMDQYMNTKTKAAAIDNMKVGTTSKRMDFVQKRNLMGYDPSDSPKDRYKNFATGKKQLNELTDYNQRMVDQQYEQIRKANTESNKKMIEKKLKQKDLDYYERKMLLDAIKIIK